MRYHLSLTVLDLPRVTPYKTIPTHQSIECIPKLPIILPCGKIKDVVLHKLLHVSLGPRASLPAIIQHDRTQYRAPHFLPTPTLRIKYYTEVTFYSEHTRKHL